MNTDTSKPAGYIEKLRSKPIEYRRKYALLVSLSVTLIVALIWSISVYTKFAKAPTEDNVATSKTSMSVFSLIKDQFQELINSAASNATIQSENLVQ